MIIKKKNLFKFLYKLTDESQTYFENNIISRKYYYKYFLEMSSLFGCFYFNLRQSQIYFV